jgi:signal transduction histidine kinase
MWFSRKRPDGMVAVHSPMPLFRLTALLLALVAFLAGLTPGIAEPVIFRTVDASFAEAGAQLTAVIDRKDTGREGWSVFPRTGERHSLWVTAPLPVQAQVFDVTLSFLSGQPLRYPGIFELTYTTAPKPSPTSKWERIVPERYSANGPGLKFQENGRFRATHAGSMIGDAVFQIRIKAPPVPVTGFRLEVFPFRPPGATEPQVSWSEYRDFCLTEFRVEAIRNRTTNIALGCEVTASHPLWAGTPASVLTDGLPGSFTHPAQPYVGSEFYFQVDLATVRRIDHIVLRGRADGYGLDRMSRLHVQLFDHEPDSAAQPVWETIDRPDGTYPGPGEADVLRPPGPEMPRARYLRISSDNPVALSPQLAEVEVYETLTAKLVLAEADGRPLPRTEELEVPADTHVLRFSFRNASADLADRLQMRWRVDRDFDWRSTTDLTAEILRPPPGPYNLEVQIRHTDGEWDRSSLLIPFDVEAHFWETTLFAWAASVSAVALALLLVWAILRRRHAGRMAALEYRSALAEERSRIARDMHDAVGARLSQIALMQDLMVRQHDVSESIGGGLKDLAKNTREAVDALDQVVWAVNPLHDSLQGVAEYLSQTASSYLAPLNIACRLDVPLEWPEVEVRAQVRHQLILAFREALQNVAKHSRADAVTLTIRYEFGLVRVVVADNGCGLPDDVAGFGKEGLANMRTRMKIIGGTCEIRSRPEGGTAVEFRAPVHRH